MIRSIFISILVAFITTNSLAATVPDLGAEWISGKLSEEEFWRYARSDRGDLSWTDSERAYLDDLYANRKEAGVLLLCEKWEDRNCGGGLEKKSQWTAVPLEKQPVPADANGWWKNPWFWGGAAILVGGAGLALSGKRVPFKSTMN